MNRTRSVRWRLRNAGAECNFQIVAIEWIDVSHPSECLRNEVPARSFAIGSVSYFAGESETAVGQKTQALVDTGRLRTRPHRHHAGHVRARLSNVAAEQVVQRDSFRQADVGVGVPARDAQRNQVVEPVRRGIGCGRASARRSAESGCRAGPAWNRAARYTSRRPGHNRLANSSRTEASRGGTD